MEPIEKNQLVTEYVGEAITQEEAEERGKVYDSCGQTYLFDLDFNEGECLYTLDAKKYGNISHFINHSVSNISNMRKGVSSGFSNAEKWMKNTVPTHLPIHLPTCLTIKLTQIAYLCKLST